MEALLAPGPVNVALLDHVVAVFSDPSHPQRGAADAVLVAFRRGEGAWTQVNAILAASTKQQTRYIALQVRAAWWRVPRARPRRALDCAPAAAAAAAAADPRGLDQVSVAGADRGAARGDPLRPRAQDHQGGWPTKKTQRRAAVRCARRRFGA